MTFVDEIAKAKGEAEWIAWKDKIVDGDAERLVHYYRGSFNICIRIKFMDTDRTPLSGFLKPESRVSVEKQAAFLITQFNSIQAQNWVELKWFGVKLIKIKLS